MPQFEFEHINILVIDDTRSMRRIVRTMLKAFGIKTVYEADDGVTGLELLEKYEPDLAIVDLKMPIIDGIQFTQFVRNSYPDKNSYLPIIILSAYADKKRVLMARDAGANEFLCKPVSAEVLFQRLNQVIRHPREFVRTGDYFGPDRRETLFSTERQKIIQPGSGRQKYEV